MTDRELMLAACRRAGAAEAEALRAACRAGQKTDTETVAMEVFLPLWREGAYAAGTPVRHTDGQDYIARLTHDSTGNALWNPAQAPSLFRLLHTKQPERAKPYVAPVGDTNIYHRDECMLWTDGAVYISTMDNNGWTPNSYAAAWRRA